MQPAQRLRKLATGIFNELEMTCAEVSRQGVSIINLSVGSPDRPPARHIIEALHRGVDNHLYYRYPLVGMQELHEAVSAWYLRRFGVVIDPEREVLVLMGSQDGLAHITWAFLDHGDLALVPDPCYPIYAVSVLLAGGEIYSLPLRSENNFWPDLSAVPAEVARRAKLMWLNYPNNPLAAVADERLFSEVVAFAREYDILVCHDLAYCELVFDGYKAPSFLSTPGAKDVGVEFYSLSKTYNMAGCRIGFVVGQAEAIQALAVIKSNIDYGVYRAVQEAGIAALTGPQDCVRETAAVYQRRRDILCEGLNAIGWPVPKPQATMFVWAPLPRGYDSSRAFALELLRRTGVVVVPGVAFGPGGEGYVRIALVQEEELIKEAVERIAAAFHF